MESKLKSYVTTIKVEAVQRIYIDTDNSKCSFKIIEERKPQILNIKPMETTNTTDREITPVEPDLIKLGINKEKNIPDIKVSGLTLFEDARKNQFLTDTLIMGLVINLQNLIHKNYNITEKHLSLDELIKSAGFNQSEFNEYIESAFLVQKGNALFQQGAIFFDLAKRLNLEYLWEATKEYKTEPRAFINDKEYMAAGPVVYSAYKAYTLKDHWLSDDEVNLAYYRHTGGKNPNNYIEHYISNWDVDKLIGIPLSEATQILDKFGLNTAKMHLILCVQAYRQPVPYRAEFYLKGTDLIKDLGLDRRKDLNLHQKLEIVLETINSVRSMLVKGFWESEVKKGRKTVRIGNELVPSLMWDIIPIKQGQTNLFDTKVDQMSEIIFKVRPGLWSSFFLNEAGYALNEALYCFSVIAENIMSLHPINEETALRIAMIQSIVPYRGFLTVEDWLLGNMPGAAYKIQKAREDFRYAFELKTLWDNKVITALTNIGFIIHFDEETYPAELRPGGKVPRGYIEKILKAKCKIEPQKLPKPVSHLEQSKDTNKPKPKKVVSGKEIKKARTEAKISQEMLATQLEKSKMYISKIENGSLKLTPENAKAILAEIKYINENLEVRKTLQEKINQKKYN